MIGINYKLEGLYLKIHESAENYLETILLLSKKQSYVRSIDIANELSFSKPSVSVAMKNLRVSGHIQVDPAGHITLTESGLNIAETILERHRVLSQMLIRLGVDPTIASEDACRLEHVISKESFDAIKKHIEQPMHK
jgi:Mn-dependent DtxR family transcriptional regulator